MDFDQDCRDMLNEDIMKKYECIHQYAPDKRELIINEIKKRGLLTEDEIEKTLQELEENLETNNEDSTNKNTLMLKNLLNTLKDMFPYEESQENSFSKVMRDRASALLCAYYISIIFQFTSGFPTIFWKDVDAKLYSLTGKAYINENSYYHLKYQYTVNGKTYVNDKTHYGFIMNTSLIKWAIISLSNGEEVTIKYNPYDPEDSTIIGFVGLHSWDYSLIVLSTLWYSFSCWRRNLTKQKIIKELLIDVLFGFPLFVVYAAISYAS